MSKHPWTDITTRPKGQPEVTLEPDGTVEVYARPVTLLLTRKQAVRLAGGLGRVLADPTEVEGARTPG